jgi:hypothetical protein
MATKYTIPGMFADAFGLIWPKGKKIIRFFMQQSTGSKASRLKDNLASQNDSLYNEKKARLPLRERF